MWDFILGVLQEGSADVSKVILLWMVKPTLQRCKPMMSAGGKRLGRRVSADWADFKAWTWWAKAIFLIWVGSCFTAGPMAILGYAVHPVHEAAAILPFVAAVLGYAGYLIVRGVRRMSGLLTG